jgi:hypothetical protein
VLLMPCCWHQGSGLCCGRLCSAAANTHTASRWWFGQEGVWGVVEVVVASVEMTRTQQAMPRARASLFCCGVLLLLPASERARLSAAHHQHPNTNTINSASPACPRNQVIILSRHPPLCFVGSR